MVSLKPHNSARIRFLLIALWLVVAVVFLIRYHPEIFERRETQFEQARQLALQGDVAASLQGIKGLLLEDPENIELLQYRGYLELELGRFEEARHTFLRIMQQVPRKWPARLGLARALTGLSRPKDALKILQEIEGARLNRQELKERGKFLGALGAHRPALEDFLSLLKDEPDDSELLGEAMSMALALEDWDLVASLGARLQQAALRPEDRLRAIESQAMAWRAQGELERAYQLYRQASTPDNLEARATLALQLERFSEASRLFRLLIEIHPNQLEHMEQLAYALERSGRIEDAEQVYRRLLSAGRPEAHILVRHAWLLNRQGRYAEAWSMAGRLPQSPKQKEEWVELRARTALWAGRTADAEIWFEKLAAAQPDNEEVQRQWARILKEKGHLQPAETIYLRLISKNNDREALVEYAWLLNSQGRYQEAWEWLSSHADPEKGNAGELELWARTALWAGFPDRAEWFLKQLWQERQQAWDLWSSLADSYQSAGRSRNAVEALKIFAARPPGPNLDSRARIAGILQAQGKVHQALSHYLELRRLEPDNPKWVWALAQIHESQGDLPVALDFYLAAWKLGMERSTELFLRIARIYRWLGRPKEAVKWFQRSLEWFSSESPPPEIVVELARAQLESGDPAAALNTLATLPAGADSVPEALLTGARASSLMQDYQLAARFLERLRRRRVLNHQQKFWLAGLYRSSGRNAEAIELFRELALTTAPQKKASLEALGDLLLDSGDAASALQAYRELLDGKGSAELHLKRARAAARAGRTEEAAASYHSYMRQNPHDVPSQIESARFFASMRRFEEALAVVEKLPSNQLTPAVSMEIVRWYLATGRFEEAESKARKVAELLSSDLQARLLLAQSLFLLDDTDSAADILETLHREHPDHPEVLRRLGEVAASRDRHFEAYHYYRKAIDQGAEFQDELWLRASRSARIRGDLSAASDGLVQALQLGASGEPAGKAAEAVHRALRAKVYFPATGWSDRNDLSLYQAGIGASYWLHRLGRLRFQFLRGELQQRETGFTRSSGRFSLEEVFLTPAFDFSLTAGVEDYARGGDLITGGVKGRYHFRDGSFAGGGFQRQTLLSEHDSREVRQFNRIIDLESLGPDFRIHRFFGFFDKVVGTDRRWRVESGVDSYQDGNSRFHAYSHYQIPLSSREESWLAFRPSFYIESFERENPFYFSPDSHFSLGAGIHAIRKFQSWDLELEFNPQWIGTEGNTGVGGQAVLNLMGSWKGLEWNAGGFLFYDDRNQYLLWNVAGTVRIPLSR